MNRFLLRDRSKSPDELSLNTDWNERNRHVFDDAHVQAFVRVRNQVTGQSSVPTAATYATDGSVFVPAYHAPMVICGPGLPEKAHQPNEYVDITRLTEAARIYTRAALDLLT